MKTPLWTLPCMALVTLSACTASKTDREIASPSFETPEQFQITSNTPTTSGSKTDWAKTFNDAYLLKLIDEVMAQNFDLQIAAANVDAAAAAAKQAGAELLPAVNLGLQGANAGSGDGGLSTDNTTLGAALDVSWEADIWGRVRAGRDAARDDFVASQLDFEFAKFSLAAQTTKAYFSAITAGQQVTLMEDNHKKQQHIADAVSAFYDEGLKSIQDKNLSNADVAQAADRVLEAKSAHLKALQGLQALLGRYPDAAVDLPSVLPALPSPLNAGVPSDVLEARPDLVAAERRVAAAFNRIDSAKAAKLPRISLTGNVGASSDSLSNLTNPTNVLWNAVSSAMFPIFNAGALDAQVDAASATQKQALASYQKAALTALQDVESSLAEEAIARQRLKTLTTVYQQAQQAADIAMETYRAGSGDLLSVLQLEQQALGAKSAVMMMENTILSERVDVYLGLGGHF